MAVHLPQAQAHGADHTLRVTLAYRGDELEVKRVERVRMLAPGQAVREPPGEHGAGFWFEIRDGKGKLLYHRVIHQPNRADREVFSPDPDQTVRREPKSSEPEGEFTLLVPDIPEGAEFVVHASPAREPGAPAKERLKHDFDRLRRGEGGEKRSDRKKGK
jgi:hypothetical protein